MVTSLDQIADRLEGLARRNQPLGELTTYRVGGRAAIMVEVRDEEQLSAVRRAILGHAVPVLVLGRGSNLLVADSGFPGLVIRPQGEFEQLEIRPCPAGGGDRCMVRAGSALALPQLARRTVEAGMTGMEWAVGVPGSVGGALRMNAGGHGSDVAASLCRYRWLEVTGEGGGEEDAARLQLGYRTSSLRSQDMVLWGEFELRRGETSAGRATISEIVRWRREHQPGGSNAGSVFVNPPDDSAGRLVEAAGLKGFRLGSALVSPKHANFIQADPGGSANDVYHLMEHVRAEVRQRLGVFMHSEVQLVGFEKEARDDTAPSPVGDDAEEGTAV